MDKLCECECPQAPVGVYSSSKVLYRHRMTNVIFYLLWGQREHGLEGRLKLLWTGLGMRGDEKRKRESYEAEWTEQHVWKHHSAYYYLEHLMIITHKIT